MQRRLRLIELDDELYFSNGPQTGRLVLGVDTFVGDEGASFRRRDVWGIDLSIRIGGRNISCRGHIAELTADWLDTPGNLQLLSRRVEWAEQRDPTRRARRQA